MLDSQWGLCDKCFLSQSVTSRSACGLRPCCPHWCSCPEWLSHLTLSEAPCPSCSVFATGLSLGPSRSLSASCSGEFLWCLCSSRSPSPVLSLCPTVLGARGLLGITPGVVGHVPVCTECVQGSVCKLGSSWKCAGCWLYTFPEPFLYHVSVD